MIEKSLSNRNNKYYLHNKLFIISYICIQFLKYEVFIFNFLINIFMFSQKDILLLQDSSNSKNYKVQFEEIKIKSDDILRVKVSSQSLSWQTCLATMKI